MLPSGFLEIATFLFGLLWGSFLNVVIYRVPREMSVVRPGSHCPGCGKPIAGYDNVPVFSYLLLRGRARCCGTRMSPRYPMVELIGGALSFAILWVVIRPLPDSFSAARAAAIYTADFALCMGLTAAAFIDAEHMFLPDSITLGGLVVGILTASLRGGSFVDAAIGAGVGFAGVYLPFIFFYKGFLGRTGMGVGDAKLVALAGAWFGWQGAVFVLFAGAFQGSIYAGVLKVLGIEPKLPQAVLDDIAELEKAAAEGDEEAKKELAEDPLTEDEDDAFILRWLKKLLGIEDDAKDAKAEASASEPSANVEAESEGEAEPPRARIPFGPFLILACLELLFMRDRIEEWLRPLFAPM
ncbi:MAG: prepilin peptidase [Deltaproteobacteria bacterium]|nr:prepilin peptidase [Deltaproteobacteria bacterium]